MSTCYATIQQMAAIVMCGKRTLERLIPSRACCLSQRSAAAGLPEPMAVVGRPPDPGRVLWAKTSGKISGISIR